MTLPRISDRSDQAVLPTLGTTDDYRSDADMEDLAKPRNS
jgi:hypothetical protein